MHLSHFESKVLAFNLHKKRLQSTLDQIANQFDDLSLVFYGHYEAPTFALYTPETQSIEIMFELRMGRLSVTKCQGVTKVDAYIVLQDIKRLIKELPSH